MEDVCGKECSCLLCLQDSRRAQFSTAICGLESFETKQEGWVPCDPLAFAAALDSCIVTAADDVLCKVEIADAKKRGQTLFENVSDQGIRNSEMHSECTGIVCKVSKVILDTFAALLDASTDDSNNDGQQH